MDELLSGLRAVAEITRLRLLFAMSHGEFNVSELTQILGQSQPRISRHLKLMCEAGLLSRFKEGSWVLFRLREEAVGGALARAIVDLLPGSDAVLARDLARLDEVKARRAEMAADYFSRNAADWERVRSLHVREEDVERAMLAVVGDRTLRNFADLGTGTGRVLQLLAPLAQNAIGLDSSREMLSIARANLERAGLRQAQVRHGDIYALPFPNGYCDLVTVHQVLHYLDDPSRAIAEAARVLVDDGRLLLVDFAPHDLEELRQQHAHRRLGIAAEQMAGWLARAGLSLDKHDILPPPWRGEGIGLTVSIWLARKPAETTQHRAQAARKAA
jgi:demethylmenaquinone methyltransferase/2-methoxy-6-polyprenyl-1,4-benzoquinol methylase/ArsR family transcriptional regulator